MCKPENMAGAGGEWEEIRAGGGIGGCGGENDALEGGAEGEAGGRPAVGFRVERI